MKTIINRQKQRKKQIEGYISELPNQQLNPQPCIPLLSTAWFDAKKNHNNRWYMEIDILEEPQFPIKQWKRNKMIFIKCYNFNPHSLYRNVEGTFWMSSISSSLWEMQKKKEKRKQLYFSNYVTRIIKGQHSEFKTKGREGLILRSESEFILDTNLRNLDDVRY